MFMLHSKCGSRLTSSVLRLTAPIPLRWHRAALPALAADDVLRRLAACTLALLAACGSGLGGSESGSESETVGMA